jgi:hypothetical protein
VFEPIFMPEVLAFGLSLFPVTGITGAGQFVYDGGLFSWMGWTQLAVLIGQCVVLALLRQSIVQQTELVDAKDVLCEAPTQYLAGAAFFLLFLGMGLYLYGIFRTAQSTS